MANIQNYLNNIKNALFGRDVRGSIHDGIDAINKEVEETTKRQVDLESTFDVLIINAGNSNAEIVDARVKSDGTSYSKLGDRLNEVDSQLEQIEKENRGFLTDNKTKIIAHRGCCFFNPENTLEAIYDAKKYGYDFVELDINKTLDEQYILMHDTTVDRMTNGTGDVTSLTLDEINQLVIDSGIYDTERIYTVPTFEQSVKLCSELKLGINLDCSKIWFNEQTINDVVFILKKYGMFKRTFFVISDNARELLTTIYPNVYVTWLNNAEDFSTAIAEVEKYNNAFISYSFSDFTEDMAIECHRYNIKFLLYGCNNYYDFKKALSYNPAFIETDYCILNKEGI